VNAQVVFSATNVVNHELLYNLTLTFVIHVTAPGVIFTLLSVLLDNVGAAIVHGTFAGASVVMLKAEDTLVSS
jgi:hypothetical protein